jgi:tetratricopeptide (TPR) repeat protein
MKNFSKLVFAVIVAFAITSQGFQCASPEFSGAKLRIQQKDYKGAISLLETEVQKNPGNEEAWYLLGGLKADQNDYAGMNTAFAQTLKISDKHAKDIYNIRYSKWGTNVNEGIGYLERASADSAQYYDQAVAHLKMASEIWPDTSLTYKYLGIAYNNKGDLDNAIISYRTAWEKGKDIDALKQVGRIYFVKGNDLENKFETANGDKLRAVKNLSGIKKGTHKNDVMAWLGAPDNVKKVEPPVQRGKKKVIQTGEKKEEWTYNLVDSTKSGEVWMYNRGVLKVSIEGEKVVDKQFVKPFEPNIDSTLHRAAVLMFDSSAIWCEQVKEINPKDNQNLNMLLQAYVKSERIGEAIRTFRTAVANDSTNKLNHYVLGILLRTDNQFQAAVGEFKTALSLDPEYNDALYDIGATLYNWGVDMLKEADAKGDTSTVYKQKFSDALPYLEKVSLVKKDDPQVFETIGTIYARLGKQDPAMKMFENADWLRKHFELKLGMKESDLISALGQPPSKEETTWGNQKAWKWVYEKEASFIVVDGIVKDWTRAGK